MSGARVNPFIGIRCMLNIRQCGLGSSVAVVVAPVYFVKPVVPTFQCRLVTPSLAFADGGGRGDFP